MSDTFTPEFTAWPKTARLFRDVVITEKIDGTNAAIHVSEDGQVVAQSRKRLITPESDNYGFAGWVERNAEELAFIFGPGLHFGEWWGQGVQRRYDMESKRFSVFNVDRWFGVDDEGMSVELRALGTVVGGQVSVAPVLYEGVFSQQVITDALHDLKTFGSKAAPGFMSPEGICVYHTQSRNVFKVTLDNYDAGKWETA